MSQTQAPLALLTPALHDAYTNALSQGQIVFLPEMYTTDTSNDVVLREHVQPLLQFAAQSSNAHNFFIPSQHIPALHEHSRRFNFGKIVVTQLLLPVLAMTLFEYVKDYLFEEEASVTFEAVELSSKGYTSYKFHGSVDDLLKLQKNIRGE